MIAELKNFNPFSGNEHGEGATGTKSELGCDGTGTDYHSSVGSVDTGLQVSAMYVCVVPRSEYKLYQYREALVFVDTKTARYQN